MAKIVIFAFAIFAACRGASLQVSVASVTGQPLKNVAIQLVQQRVLIAPLPPGQRPPPPNAFSGVTDSSGNFTFESLEAAKYSISAKRVGYLAYTGGQQIMIDAGGNAPAISIKMTPEARIEGRVTDQDGEPFRGAVGVRGWGQIGGGGKIAADETYVIGGLGPGHYYLVALSSDDGPSGELRETWPREVDVTTYYPGATRRSAATLLKITAGEILRGMDIRVRRAVAYTVRGHVVNSSAGTSIRLVDEDADSAGYANATALADGAFEMKNVLPGTYRIESATPRGSGKDPAMPSPLFSLQSIVVGKENLEDVVISLVPGARVVGRISMDNGRPLPYPPRVGLVASGTYDANPHQAEVGKDGSFTIPDVGPAKFRPIFFGLSPDSYVASIHLNGQEVINREIDLSSGTGGTLEIVLSPHAAQITGTVRNAAGDPMPKVLVSLWRPGQTSGGTALQPAGHATTDPSGSFHINSLAPGEYRIAAWGGPGIVVSETPEFLSQFDGRAATIKVDKDARVTLSPQTVEAPLIASSDIDAAFEVAR